MSDERSPEEIQAFKAGLVVGDLMAGRPVTLGKLIDAGITDPATFKMWLDKWQTEISGPVTPDSDIEKLMEQFVKAISTTIHLS